MPASAVSPDGVLVEDVGISFVDVPGGLFMALLPRGCKLPCSKEASYTAESQQPVVELHLYRSVPPRFTEAHALGSYRILGIPPGTPAKTGIRVTVTGDAKQIGVDVSDGASGQVLTMTKLPAGDIVPGDIPIPEPSVPVPDLFSEDYGLMWPGGAFKPLLFGGCKVLCNAMQKFNTGSDQQTVADIGIFCGGNALNTNPSRIGTCTVQGIPPEPRGQASFAVLFTKENNEIRGVARDVKTGASLRVTCRKQ